ncbi:MAG: helix-turn-helix transcriptional regulator [Actinomycetota bacterium]
MASCQEIAYNYGVADELVGVAEAARLLGVSRQRVHQIVQSNCEFPRPVAELSVGRIWRRADVEAWMASNPDRQKSGPKGRSRPRS